MALNNLIAQINKPFENFIQGIKLYGLAEAVLRVSGTVTETIPGIVENDGEIKYVGPDDLQSMIIYHKAAALNSRESAVVKGVGDQPGAIQNLYSLSMFIWLNRKKTKLRPDELFLYVQANIPFKIEVDPYVQVFTRINSAVLNGQQVFESEFKGVDYKLPAHQSMLQINYTLESTFKARCFEKCP